MLEMWEQVYIQLLELLTDISVPKIWVVIKQS